MHSDELMVTLVMLSLFALIFGIFYIRNRENMALIERGINPRLQQKKFCQGRLGILNTACLYWAQE